MSQHRRIFALATVPLALILLRDPAVAQCPDADGDALCDASDPCVNTAGIAVVDPFLRLRKVSPPGVLVSRATRIKFVGRLDVPATPSIDPGSTGLRLRISDGTVTTIDTTLPPGAYDPRTERGWFSDSTGAVHYYRDPHGMVDGIMRALVKPIESRDGDVTTVKVVLFGQDGEYPLPQLAATATVVFEPPASPAGQCGDATLTDCWFRNQGDKRLCRGPRLDR